MCDCDDKRKPQTAEAALYPCNSYWVCAKLETSGPCVGVVQCAAGGFPISFFGASPLDAVAGLAEGLQWMPSRIVKWGRE